VTGPFETERQALAASLWATHGRDAGMGMAAANLADLAAALSGVELGAWDKRIIEWLAGYEPSTVAVICGLISRACPPCVVFTAGQEVLVAQALADAEAYRRRRADARCADCQAAPAGTCDPHLDDLDQADAYRDLAAELSKGARS
jgi:acetyl esterase/lipase